MGITSLINNGHRLHPTSVIAVVAMCLVMFFLGLHARNNDMTGLLSSSDDLNGRSYKSEDDLAEVRNLRGPISREQGNFKVHEALGNVFTPLSRKWGTYLGPPEVCDLSEEAAVEYLDVNHHDCLRDGRSVLFDGNWTTLVDMRDALQSSGKSKGTRSCVLVCRDHQAPCASTKCIFPFHVRHGTTDGSVAWQLLGLSEMDVFDNLNPRTILDAGGNCGIGAAFLATQFPGARIVSVEPSAGNYEMIRLNTKRFENIEVVHAGLWPTVSELTLASGLGGEWSFAVYESDKVPEGQTVIDKLQGVSIEFLLTVFNMESFDVIKLDIEGSEKEVLTASEANSLRFLNRTKILLAEIHPHMREGADTAVENAFISRPGWTKEPPSGEYAVFKFTG